MKMMEYKNGKLLMSSQRMLMRFVLLFSFFLVFKNGFAQVQVSKSDTLSPLQIVERYVSPDGFPNKLKFFCCEFYKEWGADSTLGQQLPKRVQRECKVLYQDSNRAAVRVWLHDSTISRDIYFYLMKQQNWTLYAARTLVMTGMATEDLHRMDSLYLVLGKKKYAKETGHSYTFDRENLKLWSESDQELLQYFAKHQKEFSNLQKQLTKKGYYGKNDSLLNNALKDKSIKKQADALLIREISFDKKWKGTAFYLIGGISDNTVGYFYQPDPKKVPRMTEKKFILVEPLGNGWYLFKTT